MSWRLEAEYERIGRLREDDLITLQEVNQMRAAARRIEARRLERAAAREVLRKGLKDSLA